MKEKKIKLGVIASSIPLINHARHIAEEQNENIQFSLRSLEEAIPVGKEMERAGVEVIVSRGGTSDILRENLQIPVLSVPLTSMDILSSIKKAVPLGKRIMLTTFRNKLSGMEFLEKLLHIELTQGVFYDNKSLETVIISAQNQGIEVVIGGGISMKIANKYSLQMVELQTARETVVSILEDAKSVARSRRQEQEKTERYRCIINASSEGIIAVDNDGLITTINKTARRFLGISDIDGTRKYITHYIPKSQILKVLQTEKPVFNALEKINNELFVSNHIPIIVGTEIMGAVSTFKDISNVMKAENEVRRSFAKGLIAKYSIGDITHKSWLIKEVINKAKRFAPSDLTVLITGETGTGKEILAHSIHNLGTRKTGPFVSINCAGLPEQLLESELFGYEEGAFTGSRKGGKPGLFEMAHKGTIFLDEIGTTAQSVQARLLRVLQEKEVMRIGGDRMIPIDVRVIAASNRNLIEEVETGRLRQDLFFRLNVLNIHIPPLRERVEDIPLLVSELTSRAATENKLNPLKIPDLFIEKLVEFYWPGNVRQLENFVKKLVLLSDSEFSPEVFYELYQQLLEYPLMQENASEKVTSSLNEYVQVKKRENEAKMIREALREAKFCKAKAAEKLGIARSTLWRKLKDGAMDL